MDEFISTSCAWLSNHSTAIITTCTTTALSIGIQVVLAKRKENEMKKRRPTRLVVITGCDSGLGLSMALWAQELGYVVLAGCLNPDGVGAQMLQVKGVRVTPLDLTKEDSIQAFGSECSRVMVETETKLWAVVSNAGILVCGEFLWQTQTQWERQFQVNFWGAVNLTKLLKPLLLENQCRLIIISSDCSKLTLPGLSVYAGSKAALESWGRGVRLELAKYGVTVVSYQPGSFPFSSQIFGGHAAHYDEMEKNMSTIDREFYGDYFLAWKKRKAEKSREIAKIEPLQSKRHQKDLKLLLEKDLRRTPVVEYETWVQKVLLYGERFLPRILSDKLLNLTMNGGWDVAWKPVNYFKILRRVPK